MKRHITVKANFKGDVNRPFHKSWLLPLCIIAVVIMIVYYLLSNRTYTIVEQNGTIKPKIDHIYEETDITSLKPKEQKPQDYKDSSRHFSGSKVQKSNTVIQKGNNNTQINVFN